MRWQWKFVWYQDGRPIGEARAMVMPFDSRHMAELEVRRHHQPTVLQGYAPVMLERLDSPEPPAKHARR